MPPKEHRQLLRRAQQKGIAAFLHGRALFLGDGNNAASMPLPSTFPAHYQLLTVLIILVLLALGFLAIDDVEISTSLTGSASAAAIAGGGGSTSSQGTQNVGQGTKMSVVITNCFVHAVTECSSDSGTFGARRWFRSDPAKIKIKESADKIEIDGSATKHCCIALCFKNESSSSTSSTSSSSTPATPAPGAASSSAPATPAPTIDPAAANTLTFVLDTSVLNLRKLTADIQAAVTIETPRDSTGVTASKVYLGPGRFRELNVNMSYGIVVAEKLAADSAEINLGYGAVFFSTNFTDPFTITGTVHDSNYCVTPQLTTFTPSPCSSSLNTTVGNTTVFTQICPIYARSTNSTSASTSSEMNIHITASAIYISAEGSDEVRVAGAGIFKTPTLNPKLMQVLADTNIWQSQQALTYYLQVVDVLTPGFGAAFLHASRRITLELAADRLAFYTGFVMRPHYRRLPGTLSHYGCPAGRMRQTGVARPDDPNKDEIAETLTGLVDTTGSVYTREELRNMSEVFLPPQTQLAIATNIYQTVNEVNALVAFDSAAHSDLTVGEELFGATARVLSLHDRGDTVVEAELSMSTVTIILLLVNVIAAFLILIAANAALIIYRAEILSSLLVISRRSAQRQMISKEALCPYHLFLSFNTFVTWIAFRVSMYLVWPQPSFSEFLNNYFRPLERGEDSFSSGISMVQLTSLFERWMVLRYVAVPEAKGDELNEAIEVMGGRRCVVDKYVIRGLRKRLSSVVGATFELSLSSLENYYVITRDPEDQLLLDDLFFRAVIDDSTLKRTDLIKALQGWCFDVSRLPVAFVAGIEPISYTPAGMLTEDFCSSLVESFEESCASWPSYAEVTKATWGMAPSGRPQRWLGYVLRRILNSLIAVAVAVIPFLASVLILSVADFERARYSSTTSRNSIQELHATVSYWFAREQSLLTQISVWALQIFLVLFVVEPWLVLATFRSFGPTGAKGVIATVMKFLRIAVSILIAFMYWFICNTLLFYAGIVLVWWILGAIIAPNYMLVYASAAVAFVFSVTSTHNNLSTLRFEAQKKLEQRVLDEMLKLIRRTPASEALQTVQDRIQGGGSSRVTAGMLMDATSDDPMVVQKGVQELAMALNVPDAIILLLLGMVQRRGEAISVGVSAAMDAMKTPPQLTPLATQLVCIAVGAPANPRAIADAFLTLLPGEVRPHARRYDEVVIAFVGMMMKREVDPATVQEFVVATCIAELSRVSAVPPALLRHMYTVAHKITQGDQMGALAMAADVAEELLDRVPANPPQFPLLAKAGIESLRMACHRPHTLGQAVKMLVQHTPLLRKTPVIEVTAPFIMPSLPGGNAEATFASDLVQTTLRLVRQRHATTREQWNTLRRLLAVLGGDLQSLDNLDEVDTLEVVREARDLFEEDLAAYLKAESQTLVCPQGHDLDRMDDGDSWNCDWCAFKGYQHAGVKTAVVGLACAKCDFDICSLCSDNRVALLKSERCPRDHPIVPRDAPTFTCSVCKKVKGHSKHARVCYQPSCPFEICGECVFLPTSKHPYNKIVCTFEPAVTATAHPGCRACGGATSLQKGDPRATKGTGFYWQRCTDCAAKICLDCWGPDGDYVQHPIRQFCEQGHQTRRRDPATPTCSQCNEVLGGNPDDYTANTRCRKCPWDICANCSADWITGKLDVLLCREGHLLVEQQMKFKCCVCDRKFKSAKNEGEFSGYRCTKCNTSQCAACSTNMTPEERVVKACVPPPGDVLLCDMGHALAPQTRPWECNVCCLPQRNDAHASLSCLSCNWDVCENCAPDWKPKLKPASQFCDEGHLMIEAPLGEPFFCRGCSQLCSVDDIDGGAETMSMSSANGRHGAKSGAFAPSPVPSGAGAETASGASIGTGPGPLAYVCEWCEYEEDEDIFVGICLKCAPTWAPPRRVCPAGHNLSMVEEHGAECSLCHGRCHYEHDVCVACNLHLCEPCFKSWRFYDSGRLPPPVPTKIGCYNTLLLATARHQPMAMREDAEYATRKRTTKPRSKSVLAPWLAHQWLTIVAVLLLDDQVPDSSADYTEIERLTGVPRETLLLLTDILRVCMYLVRTLCPHLGTAHQQLCAALLQNGVRESQELWDAVSMRLPGTVSPTDMFTGVQITAELLAFIADSFCIEELRVVADEFAESLDDDKAPVPIGSVRTMIKKAIEKAMFKSSRDRTSALAKSVQEQRGEQVSAITDVLDRVEGHRILKAARAEKRGVGVAAANGQGGAGSPAENDSMKRLKSTAGLVRVGVTLGGSTRSGGAGGGGSSKNTSALNSPITPAETLVQVQGQQHSNDGDDDDAQTLLLKTQPPPAVAAVDTYSLLLQGEGAADRRTEAQHQTHQDRQQLHKQGLSDQADRPPRASPFPPPPPKKIVVNGDTEYGEGPSFVPTSTGGDSHTQHPSDIDRLAPTKAVTTPVEAFQISDDVAAGSGQQTPLMSGAASPTFDPEVPNANAPQQIAAGSDPVLQARLDRLKKKDAAKASRQHEAAATADADAEYDTFWAAAEAREERIKQELSSGDKWAPVRQAAMSVFAVRAANTGSKSTAEKQQLVQATRHAIVGMVEQRLLTAKDLAGRHCLDKDLVARVENFSNSDLVAAFLTLAEVFIDKRTAGIDLSSLARFYGVDISAVQAMIDPGSLLDRVPDPAGALSFGLTCVASRSPPWETLQTAIDNGSFAAMVRSIGISNVDAAVRAATWFVGESNDHTVLVDFMRFQVDDVGAFKRTKRRARRANKAQARATADDSSSSSSSSSDDDDGSSSSSSSSEDEGAPGIAPAQSAAFGAAGPSGMMARNQNSGGGQNSRGSPEEEAEVDVEMDDVHEFITMAKQHLRPLRDAALYRVESRSSMLEHEALRTKLAVQHGYNEKVTNSKIKFEEFTEPLCTPLPGVNKRAPEINPVTVFDAIEESVFHWAKLLKGRLYMNTILAAREAEIAAAAEIATETSAASFGANADGDGPSMVELGARISAEYLAAAEATAPALLSIAKSHKLPLRGSGLQQHIHPLINVFVELARRCVEKHHTVTGFAEIGQEDYSVGSFDVSKAKKPLDYLTFQRDDKRKRPHYVAAFEDVCAFGVVEAAPNKKKVKGSITSKEGNIIRMLYGVMHGVVEWYPATLPRPFWAMLTLLVMGTDTPRCALNALGDLFPLKTQELSLSLLLLEIGDPGRLGSLLPLADFTEVKVSTLELARAVLFPNRWTQSRIYCLRAIAQGSPLRLTPFAPFNTPEILTLGMMMGINHRDVFRAITKASQLASVTVITALPKGAAEMAKLPTSATLVERSLVTLVDFIEDEPYVKEVLEQDTSLLVSAFYVLDGDFVGAGRRLQKVAQSRIERAAARLSVLLMRLLANDGSVNDSPAVVSAMVDVVEALPSLIPRCKAAIDATTDAGIADVSLRALLVDVLPFVVDNVLRPLAAKEQVVEANLLDVGCPPPVPEEPEPLDPREVARFVTKLLMLLSPRPMSRQGPSSPTGSPGGTPPPALQQHQLPLQRLKTGVALGSLGDVEAVSEKLAPLIKAAVDLGLLAAEGTMTLEQGVVKVLTLILTVGKVTEMPPDALELISNVRQFVMANKQLLSPGEQGAKFFLKLVQAIVDGESEAALEMLSPDVQAKFTSIVQLSSGDLSALPDVLTNLGVMLPPAQQAHLGSTVSALQRMREAMSRAKSSAINENNLAEVISSQIFAELDTDGDNEITFAEFQLAVERLHLDLPEAEARVWFTEMDLDQRGVLIRDEFYHAVLQIRSRFVDEILCRLHLTKSLIYLAVAWFAVFLALVLAFIVLGAYGFSDGAIFTAVITGLMPAFAMVTAVLRDPGEVQRLVNRADEMAEQFFARLGRAYQSNLD